MIPTNNVIKISKMQENKRIIKSICEGNLQPDSELLAWEKWIQIRKEEIEHLANKTGRPPIDLVMNTLENVRENRERKIVLENAQIQNKTTIRNNVVWEDPARLVQTCPCKPIYEAQRTKAELGKPKVIERVGVPKIIQETEKGLTGISKKKSFMKLDSDYFHYRKRREDELQNKIKKLDPYRPEVHNLIVIGTNPGLLNKVSLSVPALKVETDVPSDVCEESTVYAVQINKSIYYKCFQGVGLSHLREMQKESISNLQSSWTYYFNTSINEMGRAKLFLKNLGNVSLRYCWKKIVKSIQFIPEIVNDPVFFFNKNDDVIYPGQEKNISFTFLSNRANIYKESWEIKFNNISFLERQDNRFEINLNADATENLDIIKIKANKIRIAIEYRALRTMIKLLVKEIIMKALNIEHQTYPYEDLLLDAEMFEMKNPEHFYHETKATELKRLYTEMTSRKWELSIKDWRQEIMKLEYDDRTKYYELLKQSNRELLRPWRESEDILQQKYKAVNVVLCQLANKFNDEYNKLVKEYCSTENGRKLKVNTTYTYLRRQNLNLNEDNAHHVHYIFCMRMYSYMCTMIETCAGIISGIDQNRRISFDFCSK